MNTLNNRVLIIGLGRFGALLAEILKEDFEVCVWSRSGNQQLAKKIGAKWIDLEKGIRTCDTIFYCVPISKFEQIFVSHLKFYQSTGPKLLIDIQSVKVAPKKVFQKHLPGHCEALLTHPIFGPDSVKSGGLAGSKMMMDQFNSSSSNYFFWKKYFLSKDLDVVEITAEEHDRQAAISQGVVFFIGKVLEDFGFSKTKVDTYWATQLHQIVHGAVGNDTWQLFVDLQSKNPYTKKMRVDLGRSLDKIYNKLLPKKIDLGKTIFGIQGGMGSFNHQALLAHVKQNKVKDFEIKYLYTSQRVLDQLHRGNIDFGLFAIQNSVGGVVEETIKAMAQYKFKIVKEFVIPISHFLMKRKDVKTTGIKKIMTHPQVIKQCKKTLRKKYSEIDVVSGKKDLIDHAIVAEKLASGQIDKNIAVIGPSALANIYDLEIIDRDLQDDKNNLTSFLLVSR